MTNLLRSPKRDGARRQAAARARAAALALPLALLAGCQDLETENINAPDVLDVFSNADNLRSAVGTSYRVFWGVAQGARTNAGDPVYALAAMGNELVIQPGTGADQRAFVVGTQEPRAQYDNLGASQWVNRKPYYDLYEAISTNRDALLAIDAGTKIGAVSDSFPQGRLTRQTRVMAKMMLGLSYAYLGMLFDQAFVADETTDISNPSALELVPYQEVSAFAIAQLREAIRLSETATGAGTGGPAANLDTIPLDWFNGQVTTRRDLERYMYSMIARTLAGTARNPQEREAVNWAAVIAAADLGVTKGFGQVPSTNISGTISEYINRTQLQTNARTSNRLLGPSDTTGRYQTWLNTPLEQRNAFNIGTPDRRIQGPGGTATVPANGKWWAFLPTQTQATTQGTYFHSKYRSIKFGTSYYNGTQTGGAQLIETTNPLEMRFLKAEGLFRTGNRQGAADLINITRVANGNLPPVTVNGPPNNASCVPRKDDGTCGDLWDALMYEKRLEMFGVEPIIAYTDQRGWGKLVPGTMIHFPITGRELQTLGLPVYTFGGSGPGSAP
jgi:hypothetical protein